MTTTMAVMMTMTTTMMMTTTMKMMTTMLMMTSHTRPYSVYYYDFQLLLQLKLLKHSLSSIVFNNIFDSQVSRKEVVWERDAKAVNRNSWRFPKHRHCS